MTATATALRVPVRTWQAKAILTAAIGEGFGLDPGPSVGFVESFLLDERDANDAIDRFRSEREEDVKAEAVLFALRDLEPGPTATLNVPSDFDVGRRLAEIVDTLLAMKPPPSGRPSQREIAEAVIVAVDLRDEILGGDA